MLACSRKSQFYCKYIHLAYISFVVIISGAIPLELQVHIYVFPVRLGIPPVCLAWGDSPYPGSVLRPLPCYPAAHNLLSIFFFTTQAHTYLWHAPISSERSCPPDHLNHGSLSSGPLPCLDSAALLPSLLVLSPLDRRADGLTMDFRLRSLGLRGTGASGLMVACFWWPGFLQQRYLLKYKVLHYTIACS
jgi:hypothetical protein